MEHSCDNEMGPWYSISSQKSDFLRLDWVASTLLHDTRVVELLEQYGKYGISRVRRGALNRHNTVHFEFCLAAFLLYASS